MKNIFTILFLSIIGFAQAQVSVVDIEKELTKDFKRIKFWNDSLAKSKELFIEDSLDDAAIHFKNKLLSYTGNTPQTMSHKFLGLKNLGLHIATSADGSFKIYSWETKFNNGVHYFETIYQFKLNRKIFSRIKIKAKETDPGHYCDEIFTVKIKMLNSYIAFFQGNNSEKTNTVCLKAFEMHDTGFKDEIEFFKTKTTMSNELNFEYLANSKVNIHDIVTYNDDTKILTTPSINDKGELKKGKIEFKFNGHSFEK